MTHPYRVNSAPLAKRWGVTRWPRLVVRLMYLWRSREERRLRRVLDRVLEENWEQQMALNREMARANQLDRQLDDIMRRLRSPQATDQKEGK
jgi:hypothetical protein